MSNNNLIHRYLAEIQPSVSQLIKGVSCLIIVVHHYSQLILLHCPESSNLILKIFSKYGGYTAVAIFFFLSGYGLMESESKRHLNLSQFLKKRYWKILKPVLVINIIFLPIFYILKLIEYTSFIDLLTQLLSLELYDGVIWFVQVLFFLYGYFFLSSLLKKPTNKIVILFLFITIHSIIGLCVLKQTYQVFSIVAFPLGVVYSLYKNELNIVSTRWKAAICVMLSYFLVTFLITITTGSIEEYLQHTSDNILILALLVIVASIIKEIPYKPKLGAISYEVFLVHYKIITIYLALFCTIPNLIILLLYTIGIAFIVNLINKNIHIKWQKSKQIIQI